MSQKSEAFTPPRRLVVERRLVSPAPELSDGARDGVVKASVQRPKVVRADRRVHFHREIGYGLAHVTVVVDDLRHGESLKQEIPAVKNGTLGDVGVQSPRPGAQSPNQLSEEQRHAMIDLVACWSRHRPCGDLCPATLDDLFAVYLDELE